AAGVNTGAYARGQLDVDFSGGSSFFKIGYDVNCTYQGTGTPADWIGSMSFQDSTTSQSLLSLRGWTDPGSTYGVIYRAYDALGSEFDTVFFDDLPVNHWYREEMTVDFTTHQVLEVTLTDLETMEQSTVAPVGTFLQGGAASTLPLPTAFRFFTGAADNSLAWDNFNVSALPELVWDKTVMQGDWSNPATRAWTGGPPDFPGATDLAVIEGNWTSDGVDPDPDPPLHPIIVDVTGNEAAANLRMRDPGLDEDQGNYVWIRRTTGWDAGLGVPDDTFGSLTVGWSITAPEANNAIVMDQGTELNTGSGASQISTLWWFGSDTHPGPTADPGDDVTIPIEDVVVTTPGDLTVLHRMDDASFPGDPSRKFVKRGQGTLSFDSTTGVMLTANTTFRIEEGAISLRGHDPLGGSTAPIELAGGDLEITVPVIPGAGPADALAWLSFNNPADPGKDDGPNGNHGTVEGATWTTDTVFGGALAFDGDNDYVNFGQPSPLDSIDQATAMTVAMWFKRVTHNPSPNDADTNHGINNVLLAHSSQSTGDNFELGTQADGIELYIDSQNGGDDFIRNPGEQPPGGIANGIWHHIAVTYDSSDSDNEVSLYFNGELIREWGAPNGQLDTNATTTDTPWSIGIARPDRGDPWAEFGGIIDEFYLYDRVLSEEEILPMVGARALDLSSNTLVVAADSGLSLIATGTVPFGGLTLEQGILTVEGMPDLVQFPGTDVPKYTGAPGEPADDRTVGVNLQVPIDLGPITGNDSTATLVKEGPEDLVLNPLNTGLDSATIAAKEGRTISVMGGGVDPLGDATIRFVPGSGPGSPIGAYTFDDPADLGHDDSGHGKNAVPVGDPTAGAGVLNGAVDLDGDDGLNPTQPPFLEEAADARTVGLWFQQMGTTGNQMLYDEGGVTNGFSIGVLDGGTLQARVKGGTPFTDLVDSAPLSPGWHHVVAVYGNSTFTLYLDNEQIATASALAQIPAHTDDPGIGYQNNESALGDDGTPEAREGFQGLIDELYIYDKAFSAWEVARLFDLDPPFASGELLVSSSDGNDFALDNALVVDALGTLTASDYSEAGGSPTVTLADLTLNDVLTLNATDGYRFAIPGAVTSTSGGLILAAGETEVGDSLNVAVLEVDGGTLDRGLVEHDIVVSGVLRLITDSLNVAGQTPVPITSNTEVVIGADQAFTMKGPFDGRALDLGGTLTLIGPQDLTVTEYLTMATDRDFTGHVLTTTGADLTVNSAVLTVENALSANTVDLN
ncbi:MAG: LamG domain-containing protein, partial [Planctomycetota bacterium]